MIGKKVIKSHGGGGLGQKSGVCFMERVVRCEGKVLKAQWKP